MQRVEIADLNTDLDLTTALAKLHELQLNDGDLAREYWGQIGRLLQEAAMYEQRARVAEDQLRDIQAVLRVAPKLRWDARQPNARQPNTAHSKKKSDG